MEKCQKRSWVAKCFRKKAISRISHSSFGNTVMRIWMLRSSWNSKVYCGRWWVRDVVTSSNTHSAGRAMSAPRKEDCDSLRRRIWFQLSLTLLRIPLSLLSKGKSPSNSVVIIWHLLQDMFFCVGPDIVHGPRRWYTSWIWLGSCAFASRDAYWHLHTCKFRKIYKCTLSCLFARSHIVSYK